MVEYPFDLEFIKKRMAIPQKIAKLSYLNEKAAIKYMRIWGEKKMPITILFDELIATIKQKRMILNIKLLAPPILPPYCPLFKKLKDN
ncbi:hypothetical protein MKY20_19890 [Cytobacillus sp. FSL W8-0315]|uniref:hypothetical protein n=1 Tax=Cytobacillus sp. FSL W8-0315 TaxID=2921600 RepID=UPI0030F79FB6